MAIISIDQLPSKTSSGSSDSNNSNIIPINQLPSKQASAPDTSNMYGQPLSFPSEINLNEEAAPISLGQAANLGTIRTPEYKAEYLKQALGNQNVSVADDGRIKITDKSGNDSYVEPHRQGIINWLKDNSTKLAEFVGEQGLPIAGQIGADIATAAAAPETGGTSLLASGAANTAGAAFGTGIRQAYANQLIGEPYSAGDVALQGAAGGASVPIAAAIAPVAKGAVRAFGSLVGKVAKPLVDAFPSIAEPLFNVSHMNSEWLIQQMRDGKPASEIINEENANPGRAGEIVRNLLFGDRNGKTIAENFVPQYQRLLKPIASEPGRIKVLDDFFSKNLGLDKDTLDILKTRSASELLDPELRDPRAWRNLANVGINSIGGASKNWQDQYGKVLNDVIEKTKNQSLNISPSLKEMQDSLVNSRILDDSGQAINNNYSGKSAKEGYGDILGKLKQIDTGGEKDNIRSSGRGLTLTPAQYQDLLNKKQPFDLTKMRVSDIRDFKAEVQPLLDRTFNGTGMSDAEKRPLAQFINKLDTALEGLKGAAPLKEMNKKYANFKNAESFFRSLKDGDVQQQQGVISQLRQALSKDPATRATNQSYITDLDNQLGKNKILPRLKLLGAAQDLNAANYNEATTSLVKQMKSIHQSGLNQDAQKEGANLLKTIDNAIPQKAYKFYNDMRDHLTAEAFSSNRQNFLRVRALDAMLGVTAITSGHPALGSLGVLYGMQAFSPKGIGKGIVHLNELSRGATNIAEKGASKFNGAVTSPQAKALLASLIKRKTGL